MTTEHWQLEGEITEAFIPQVGDTGSIRVGAVETWVQVAEVTFRHDHQFPGCHLILNVLMPEHPLLKIQPGMDGPPCRVCDTITYRAGTCWLCPSCGETTGCG
jgi:hypothetical protein